MMTLYYGGLSFFSELPVQFKQLTTSANNSSILPVVLKEASKSTIQLNLRKGIAQQRSEPHQELIKICPAKPLNLKYSQRWIKGGGGSIWIELLLFVIFSEQFGA
jgi:hypothetical protein